MPIDFTSRGLFKRFTDKTILEGIRNQDDKILNWLYDNYLQTVKRYVLNNSGTTSDVSDVFQEAIIILYKQVCDGTPALNTELKGYFFGIARNIWNNQLRQKRVTEELNTEVADIEASDEVTDNNLERIVNRAFRLISPDMQCVLTLFSEGASYEEIAEKMNLKNETYARRKKYLAKEALIEKVKEDPEYQEYLRFRN